MSKVSLSERLVQAESGLSDLRAERLLPRNVTLNAGQGLRRWTAYITRSDRALR